MGHLYRVRKVGCQPRVSVRTLIDNYFSYDIHCEWTEDGTEVNKTNKPSVVDIAWLNLMYPPRDSTKFERALSESMDSCLSKDHRDSILKLYSDGEWDRLRSKIASVSNPKSKFSKRGFWGK